MRLFIAVDLPLEVKKAISSLVEEIKKKDIVKANFVSPKNLHITLKFLGEVKDIDKIRAKCSEIKAEKFKASLSGVGAFPSQEYIRILWIGILRGAKQLERLYKDITDKVGIKDAHAFSSHLTFARVKAVKDKQALNKFFTDKEFGEFEVKEFKLMKSTLTPEGPIYEEVEKFKLT